MELRDLYDVNTISRECKPDAMKRRYYGHKPVDGLFASRGAELRSLGFSLVPDSATIGHDGIWKRMDDKSGIVCYITPASDKRCGHVSLRYVGFKLKAADFPMTDEYARLLFAGASNSALMALGGCNLVTNEED